VKEIAYNYLEITERLYTFSWIKFKTLTRSLIISMHPTFKRGALIPRKQLVSELNLFLAKTDPKLQR
jgi:alpha-amylase/alpha-mannosidase (GH57 family)